MSAPARAERLVLGWARLYTRGLDAEAGERRLGELASDCFEQRRRGREVGAPPSLVATSMVARTLAGVPADLLWRQGRLAASRDGSLARGGRPVWTWTRKSWWLVLAALLGALLTVLGVGLPFEDRTIGSVVGGVVTALLGLTMLAGVAERRRDRRVGGVMIAVGTLPTLAFVWTIVLPVLGIAVAIPAVLDATDAAATGRTRWERGPRSPGVDRALLSAVALLAAAITAAFAIGTQTAAAALGGPALAVVIAVAVRRRLRSPSRLARAGMTAVVASVTHAVLRVGAVLGTGGAVDLGAPLPSITGLVMSAAGLLGVVVWVVEVLIARDRARPA